MDRDRDMTRWKLSGSVKRKGRRTHNTLQNTIFVYIKVSQYRPNYRLHKTVGKK